MIKDKSFIINGQKVSRLKASRMLFSESWKYLMQDKEMMLIPLLTGVVYLALFLAIFITEMNTEISLLPSDDGLFSLLSLVFTFFSYILIAFSFAITQAAISSTVHHRVNGGNLTLYQSLGKAFGDWKNLLIWSVLTGLIGFLFQRIIRSSNLLAKIGASVAGLAWPVLTYFVVPAIVIDKKSTVEAIAHSGRVFKETWGETIISNISLMSITIWALVPALATLTLLVVYEPFNFELGFVGAAIFIGVFVSIALVHSTLSSIIKTLLYLYGVNKVYPSGFNSELLELVLIPSVHEYTSSNSGYVDPQRG